MPSVSGRERKKLIYHNGWWHGNRTSFYRMQDEDATIIALCNNDCRYVYKVKEMADIFGEDGGVGARSAVGMGSLPSNIPVEVECIFEVG